jgi:hypothetical protein
MTSGLDPFDELAALFLTEPEGPGTTTVGGRTAGFIEALVVGHLPVRASVWLTPYVDSLAREHGPAALLRLDGDVPSLELLRGPAAPLAFDDPRDLRACIAQVARHARVWVVCPAAGVHVSELPMSGVDRMTILSSADEAAVVAAYQIVKDASEAAATVGVALPGIGIAVVGTGLDQARQVVNRLTRTTASFLGVQVPLVTSVPRMDSGIRVTSRLQFSAESCPTLQQAISWIAEAVAAPGPTPLELPLRGSPPAASWNPGSATVDSPATKRSVPIAAAPVEPSAAARVGPRPAAPAPPPRDAGVRPKPSPVSAAFKLRPKPAVVLEPKLPARAQEPDNCGAPVPLARYVDGLSPLPVRSPGHERIEIAVDRGGRLHLLARESMLRELHVVTAWAAAHRELIALACPNHLIDPAARIVSHVFTECPSSVADLHGSELHLHVLAPVAVGDRTGWYAAALNTP